MRRNVDLTIAPELFSRHDTDSHLSNLPYQHAHMLEQRSPDSISGVWGISHWRSERMFGNVTRDLHPTGKPYAEVEEAVWKEARWFRLLSYHRIESSTHAIQQLQRMREVRFACEINEDWYDPPKGEIPVLGPSPDFSTSHAFPLLHYDPASRRFVFPNSWGHEWGDDGLGSLPIENWDRSIVSAWNITTHAVSVPANGDTGVVSRGWKLGDRYGEGVHCVEIVDADNDEYLAWAFCIRRNGFLDVDEFFVRPEARGKGYAIELCRLVQRLSHQTKLEVRLVVSFADTEDYAIDGASAVARMFGVNLVDADVRWASMFGIANAPPPPPRNWKPVRPESILEKLRPRDEQPLRDPRQYTVFFGTNRKPVDAADLSKGFTNERDYELHRGHCLVEIPATHKFGSVGRGWIPFFKKAASDEKRIVTTQPLNAEEMRLFARQLTKKFEQDKHNLLFLHGFKNSFEDAALRSAQLGFDLKLPGATFFYSWPAKGSLKGYPADEATIETSVTYCLSFVIELLETFPDIPLHIVSHSMGNRLAVRVFEKLALMEKPPGQLGQLVFAAADIDVDLFAQSLPSIETLGQRLTAYTSRGDLAVHLSARIHDYPRLGLAPPIQCFDGVDTVLAEGFAISELLGHDYVTEASPLLSDLFNLIRYGSNPDERPRTIRETDSKTNLPFWSLPLA
ncbi:hypothetical protein CA13_01990 [Planctomycetes bacterium CA13]|uniref:Alpha/beta hydrolase family protein n=1 Tax=Novipirellula herctigrandis TaxID=2527986 RepID=A0A5C5YUS9_9BACT|nr:hypothetical protein CA13_01990 [Planctomycetes bacterium CA13]